MDDMYYIIDKDALRGRVEEEVSRVADEAYADSGDSLYDSVVLTSRDEDMVGRFIDDAVSSFVRRTFDICEYSPETETDGSGQTRLTGRTLLRLHVPDFDKTMEDRAMEEISEFIALYAATSVFQSRRPAVVPQYTDMAKAAMDRAVALLKSRKYPSEKWS